MTDKEAVLALCSRLTDNFSTLPVETNPNKTQADPPAGGYVGMHPVTGVERQVSSDGGGSAGFQADGVLDLEIYVPRGVGDGLAWDVVDEIKALYRSWYDTDIIVGEMVIDPVGLTEDEKYWQTNLHIFFEVDSDHNLNPAYEAPIPVERIYGRHTLNAHGYTVGTALRADFTKAIATSEAALAVYVVSRVCTADVFEWTKAGMVTWPAHGLGSTRGTPIFLSADTAGLVTTTAPTDPNDYRQPLGSVEDVAKILWNPATVATERL
jgi:hypothetical protein